MNRIVKRILFAVLAIVAGGVWVSVTLNQEKSLLTCVPANNDSVSWYDIPYRLTGQIAMATIDYKGQPVILYDKKIVSEQPAVLQKHLAAHECSHIMLGHVNSLTSNSTSAYNNAEKIIQIQNRENDADCKSVELLVKEGWTKQTFFELVNAWNAAPMPHEHVDNRIANLMRCSSFPKD